MKKGFKIISLLLAVALLLSITVISSFATEVKRVEITDSKGSYFTVSNVTEIKQAGYFPLFVAQAPVTVTFYGDDISREFVSYFIDSKVVADGVEWGDYDESVKFDVLKYKYFDSDTIYDQFTHPAEDICLYVSGNYATLTKPGYYVVNAAPEAGAGDMVLIQITGTTTPAPATPAPATPTPAAPTPAAPTPETLTVKPNASKVLVDGKTVSFEAYTINGFNYFKLRDLAMAINGTAKQFDIAWDGVNNAIRLTSGKAYTVAGGELAVSANLTQKEAKSTSSKIFVDGTDIELTAYTIGGYNYFKLRDIGYFFGFSVEWDGINNTIVIDTSKSYID